MDLKKIALGLGVILASCAPTVTGQGRLGFDLAGSEWGFESGEDVPFVRFEAEGNAVGNGGCNRFSGSFEQSGQRLSFGPIRSTKMACMVLDGETAFFNALGQTRAFEGDHLKIILKSESGDELLALVRRDWD